MRKKSGVGKNEVVLYEEMTYSERYQISPQLYDNVPLESGSHGFSIRTYKRLKAMKIKTVGDLLRVKESKLLRIDGFGKKCLSEVNSFIMRLKPSGKRMNDASSQDRISIKNVETEKHNEKAMEKTFIPKAVGIYRDEIFSGQFSNIDAFQLSESEKQLIAKYEDAYSSLDEALIKICKDEPDRILLLIKMLLDYVEPFEKRQNNKQTFRNLCKKIPAERLNNYAKGYIMAYSREEKVREKLRNVYSSEDSFLKDIDWTIDYCEQDISVITDFLKWCSFDLDKEIEELFDVIYKKDNMRIVVMERSQNHTLEQTGKVLGVTRERVRQIERKAKHLFVLWYKEGKLLEKISALRNADYVLTGEEIQNYLGEHASELIFLLRGSEGMPYSYDPQLGVFITEDSDLSEHTRRYVDEMPEVFNKSKLNVYLQDAEDKGISVEMLMLAIQDVYKQTGDTYHRSRLSLAEIYDSILRKYYKTGIRAYDEVELTEFRNHVYNEFGDVGLPSNNRALTARISSIGILCDRGTYKSKTGEGLSQELLEKIRDYIDNSDSVIFLTNTLFSIFEDELLAEGVNNKYYLQGLLHEAFGERYIYRRDYISKDDSVTSIYNDIVNYIKGHEYPISKREIMETYPGLSDIVFAYSVSGSDVLNFFGKYIHASKLKLSDVDIKYFKRVIEKLISNTGYCNVKDVYRYIDEEDSYRLKRLFVMYPYSLFSLLEYLYREEYQFLRPFIAKNGVILEQPSERMNELLVGSDTIELSEILEFAREINYSIYSILDFVNEHNDTHLLINERELAKIEYIGASLECALQIESAIINELNGTTPISELISVYTFPRLTVPWTEWLIYSVLHKWSKRLEVDVVFSGTSHQFRYATPVVALRGKLEVSDLNVDNPNHLIGEIDSLDDIDSLIEDLVAEEIGEL